MKGEWIFYGIRKEPMMTGNRLWDWEGDNDEGGVDFYGIGKEPMMKKNGLWDWEGNNNAGEWILWDWEEDNDEGGMDNGIGSETMMKRECIMEVLGGEVSEYWGYGGGGGKGQTEV